MLYPQEETPLKDVSLRKFRFPFVIFPQIDTEIKFESKFLF
jgi:hypothetical protein